MKRRGSKRGRGRASGRGGDGEGSLRIHLKRSCTDRKLVPGNTDLALTTDDWHKFKRLLASKTFAVHDTKRIPGDALTATWALEAGFREPVIAVDKAGMGIKVPDATFTVADVARTVGNSVLIRPMHVGEQVNIDQPMTLAEFAEYFETCTKPGQAILNMISLEFSDTPLAELVRSPQLVRDIDWLNWCWPDDRKHDGQFPKVQYYCLMSQGGSYTDFHVDFGGTSVWYHILRGKKEFLLIRPTASNLKLYEDWIRSPTQSQTFFGDLADVCYRVFLNAGETLMIPSGWIHAVFTPKPSLVFGGNFIHALNIPMQLQIHGIEVRAKILHKFRFPYYREMMFFAASRYLGVLRDLQGDLKCTPDEASEDSIREKESSDCRLETTEGAVGDAQASPGITEDAKAHGKKDGHEGLPVSAWEIEGLAPLAKACREWIAAESTEMKEVGSSGNSGSSCSSGVKGDKGLEGQGARGDGGEIPEEWGAAAKAAGCSTVEQMLDELDARISALEETGTGVKVRLAGAAAEVSWTPGSPRSAASQESISSSLVIQAGADRSESSDKCPASDGGAGAGSGREVVDAANGASPAPVASSPAEVTKPAEVAGAGQSKSTPGGDPSQSPGSVSYSIPKLKISLKPPSPRPAQAPGTEVETNGGSTAGAGTNQKATSRGDGSTGGSSTSSLKLVLKAPSISAAGGSPRSNGGVVVVKASESVEGGSGRGSKLKETHEEDSSSDEDGGAGRGRGSREVPAWLKAGSSGDKAKKNPISLSLSSPKPVEQHVQSKGHHHQQAEKKKEKEGEDGDDFEEEESWLEGDGDEGSDYSSGAEGRVGRGGKRRARPLGSRLRAIARLGDDAAGGGSEDDDSADEYKPDLEDDTRPDDHKIKLDAEDVRCAKRARSAATASPKKIGSGRNHGNTWSGFGRSSDEGDLGGAGRVSALPSAGRTGVLGGVRLSVTKQEALRSKGVFKIAPQSKLPVQSAKPAKKDKKPLTAKQKLLAKMRR